MQSRYFTFFIFHFSLSFSALVSVFRSAGQYSGWRGWMLTHFHLICCYIVPIIFYCAHICESMLLLFLPRLPCHTFQVDWRQRAVVQPHSKFLLLNIFRTTTRMLQTLSSRECVYFCARVCVSVCMSVCVFVCVSADLWPKRDLCQKLVETWMKNGKWLAFPLFFTWRIAPVSLWLLLLVYYLNFRFPCVWIRTYVCAYVIVCVLCGTIDWNPFGFFSSKKNLFSKQWNGRFAKNKMRENRKTLSKFMNGLVFMYI